MTWMVLQLLVGAALAQETVLTLDGAVSDDGTLFERVPFDVPAGTVEIEVRHASLNSANFFDWGVNDPNGFRGWGGGNPEPAIIGEQAASRSYLPGPMPAGTWNVSIGKPVMGGAPFDYSLEVVLRESATLPPQERGPFVPPAPLSSESAWYAGDLHVHSLESGDASAELDAIADLARARGLDFVVVTDHNTSSTLDFLTAVQARHPDILLIPGQEYTTYNGHAGAIGVTVPLPYELGIEGLTVEDALDAIRADGALVSINHPALDIGNLCRGCAWEHEIDFASVDAVEIQTGGLEPVGALFTPLAIAFWEDAVAQGHHLAALGGSDDHRAGVDLSSTQSPIGDPTTLVYARELSIEAILEGISNARTAVKLQGPDDPFVELLADGVDPHTDTWAAPGLRARVVGGADTQLVIVVNGEDAESEPITEDDVTLELDPIDTNGEAWVRAEIRIGGDPQVVTSHVWFTRTEPEPDADPGCGCAAQTGLSAGALVVLGGFGLVRRQSRSS
jgi:hypothetical protein